MRKIAFVFPGQGSQSVGMARQAIEQSPQVMDFLRSATDLISIDLRQLILEGPDEELKRTSKQQPAVLAVSLALLSLVRDMGVVPDMVAGHSLGEYTALTCAGCIAPLDAISLVYERGRLMEAAVEHIQGGMAAVMGLSTYVVDTICNEASSVGVVEVANYNCPGQVVISGEIPAVERALELAKAAKAKRSVMLPVSGPFHSSLMQPVGEKLREAISRVSISNPAIPLVMNFTAEVVSDASTVSALMVKQVSGSVKWDDSIRNMAATGINTFVEIGPGKVLSGLIKRTVDIEDLVIISVEDLSDLDKLTNIK